MTTCLVRLLVMILLGAGLLAPGFAATLRYAPEGDALTLDPRLGMAIPPTVLARAERVVET
jgi:hypothetical protein